MIEMLNISNYNRILVCVSLMRASQGNHSEMKYNIYEF